MHLIKNLKKCILSRGNQVEQTNFALAETTLSEQFLPNVFLRVQLEKSPYHKASRPISHTTVEEDKDWWLDSLAEVTSYTSFHLAQVSRIVKRGVYRHYKGGIYEVLAVAYCCHNNGISFGVIYWPVVDKSRLYYRPIYGDDGFMVPTSSGQERFKMLDKA